jgi:PAS domain S-box-containing protein
MFRLPPAHRLARLDYPPRAVAFAFSLLLLEALMIERGFNGWMLFFGVLQFLVYPHVAYLYACYAVDSKRAEINNLFADSLLLGVWSAQMHFALWPSCGACAAVCLNNAATGGFKRFAGGIMAFFAAAFAWSAVLGFPFEPGTGPWVSGLCAVGIVTYCSWIGISLYRHNRRVVRTREALRSSEEQFRFIAEHAGDFVAVLDANGRFRYASASHLEHFPAEAVAEREDWVGLVYPDDRERARNFLRYMMESRSGERATLRVIGAGGLMRTLECDGNPVWDRRGNTEMVILVCRDITERSARPA